MSDETQLYYGMRIQLVERNHGSDEVLGGSNLLLRLRSDDSKWNLILHELIEMSRIVERAKIAM
jgi:hypothetical protein